MRTLLRTRPVPVALGLLLLFAVLAPIRSAPAQALGYSPDVDAPSAYDAQWQCTRTPKPGTVALAKYLMRAYPATGSLGMMRACGSGGTSEHKDGRAFDWAADVRKPVQKASAYAFIVRALAPDAAGNAHALARRMGIMYLIYNDTIWSSYRDFQPRPYLNSGCKTKKKCSRSLRHLNHVHISLGYAGAAAQTSWYRSRNVTALPVVYPRTNELDPENTAVTGFTVPATGAMTYSPFFLRAGVTYRIVATGAVRWSPTAIGDANCVGDSAGWRTTDRGALPMLRALGWGGGWGGDDWTGGGHQGSEHPDSPYALPLPTTHGLVLQGGLRWEGACRADHTYQAWYTPATAQRLQLKYVDLPAGDNSGAFSVYVARDDITTGSLARR